MLEATEHRRKRLPLRVLMVDDDVLVRRNFRRLLRRLVEVVEVAPDGQEALALVLSAPMEDRPDLVLSDLAMPGLNGIELAKRLHQYDASLPVVLVTAHETHELPGLVEDGVLDGVLRKPTPLARLREVLERHARESVLSES